MALLTNARRLRWTAPAVVAAGVAVAAITTTSSQVSAQPDLPSKTAGQLLAAVQRAHPEGLSGTIVETADIGLPSLPAGDAAGGDLSWQSMLTGSHTLRVWYAGPDRQRIAILGPMSERDLIHNGSDIWSYTSTTNTVTHSSLPAGEVGAPADPGSAVPTPQRVAAHALRAIDPSTEVAVDNTASVAGRDAYQLSVAPRDGRSLIGSVRIAIDAATSVPLRVQVFARGAAAPAFQVGFTDVSFSTPDPSVFDFFPPDGATVTRQSLGSWQRYSGPEAVGPRAGAHAGPDASRLAGGVSTLGSGWTTVVQAPAKGLLGGSSAGLLTKLSTPVAHGRLVSTSLLSVLVTDDGRVLAGPVTGAALQQVAATGRGL